VDVVVPPVTTGRLGKTIGWENACQCFYDGAVGKLHAYRIMQGFVPKKQVYTKNLPSMTHNPYSRV